MNGRRYAVALSSLHHLAEQIERHNWCRIVYADTDWKRSLEYKQRADELWKEVDHWRKTLDEQAEVAKYGKGVDRTKLALGA